MLIATSHIKIANSAKSIWLWVGIAVLFVAVLATIYMAFRKPKEEVVATKKITQ